MKDSARMEVVVKLKRLGLMARELRDGKQFEITRLTTLKSLCEDPVAAGCFTLHLTERAKGNAKSRYNLLIANAIRQMKNFLANPRDQAPESLWETLRELEDSQNETKGSRWGPVRIVHCGKALLAEHALHCAARPWESSHWGYQAARRYAERYDPRYGTGLIPESASAVEEIVDFWARYHFGRNAKNTLGLSR